MLERFFEKNLTYRIVIGSLVTVLLSLFVFFVGYTFAPKCNGLNGLQLLAKSNLGTAETWCVLYMLTIETICIFLLPALCLLVSLYKSPRLVLQKRHYTWREILRSPLILTLVFIALANIPGINLLSQINTDGILCIVGEDSDLWTNYQRMNDFTEMLLANSNSMILNIVCMAFVPAICEEIFFRGLLQTIATSIVKNVHVAVLLVAAIFSILHGDIFNFIPRFVLGIFLGYLFIFTQNIFYPILAHCLHNASVVLLRSVTSYSEELETIGTTDNKVLLGIASLLILAGFTTSLITSLSQNTQK